MTEQPKAGELLVGAYLKLVEECELVTYNQRSARHGDQIEVDVIGMSPGEENELFVCEVSTHLGGLNYSRRVDSERWADYGSYQSSLATLERKFEADSAYATDIFASAERYRFQRGVRWFGGGWSTACTNLRGSSAERPTGNWS